MEFFQDVSPWVIGVMVLAVFGGAMVQHLLGMGFGLFSSPFLMLINPQMVPAVVIMLGLLVSAQNYLPNLRSINMRQCGYALVGRIFGTMLGATLLVWLVSREENRLFALIFAGMLIVMAVMSLLNFPQLRRYLSPKSYALTTMGFVSGIFGTVTSVGGPPMALIFQHQEPRSAQLHLNFILGTGAIMSVLALSIGGLISTQHLVATAVLCVPAAIGIVASRLIATQVHQHYRMLVLLLVIVASIVIIFRAL